MLYTIDPREMVRYPTGVSNSDILYIVESFNSKYEFKGYTYLGLPVFYFDVVPPDYLGVKWIKLYKEC